MNEIEKIDLEPKYPPAGKGLQFFIGILVTCFVVFFFMIVGMKMYRELGNTASIILLTIPLVFLLIFPIRRALRSLNLRPFVYVHSRRTPMDEDFTFHWKLKTGPLKVRRLTIMLEGRLMIFKYFTGRFHHFLGVEKTKTVYRKNVISLNGNEIEPSGACTVRFPGEQEFENHTDIIWVLRVKCDSFLLPYKDISFPITPYNIHISAI